MIGERFGLVTVKEVATNRRTLYLCECTCGEKRWFKPSNLKKHPPKTHRQCFKARQYEMQFIKDMVRRNVRRIG